jgi:hypothetical protein
MKYYTIANYNPMIVSQNIFEVASSERTWIWDTIRKLPDSAVSICCTLKHVSDRFYRVAMMVYHKKSIRFLDSGHHLVFTKRVKLAPSSRPR